MTYNVFGGTLNLAQSINHGIVDNILMLNCLVLSGLIMSEGLRNVRQM